MKLAPAAWIAVFAFTTSPVNAGPPDQTCTARWSIAGVSIGSVLAGQSGRDVDVVMQPGSEPDVITLRATIDSDGVVTTLTATVRSGAASRLRAM